MQDVESLEILGGSESLNILHLAPTPGGNPIASGAGGSCRIHTVGEVGQAHQLIEKNRYHALVADAATPQGGALAVLDQARKQRPKMARFLSSPAANVTLANRCIWNCHRVIDYEVTSKRLADDVLNALEVDEWVSNKEMQNLIASLRTLPARPSTYFKILNELNDSSADVDGLVKLIGEDMAVTTKLLQTVNSPLYGGGGTVTDLTVAIQTLGFETVKMLVVAVQAVASLDRVKPVHFSIDKIWRFSLNTAEVARKIARSRGCHPSVGDQAYLAALLHDIGKAVLACNFDSDYHKVLVEAAHTSTPIIVAETNAFGVNHSQVGAFLVALWGLPRIIVETVGHHHQPSRGAAGEFGVLGSVHAANLILSEIPDAPPDEPFIQHHGLNNQLADWRSTWGVPDKSGKDSQNAPAPSSESGSVPVIPTPAVSSAKGLKSLLRYFRN